MLPEITRRVCPPRALSVPYPLGYPLGVPGDLEHQVTVLEALLSLCERVDVPVLESWPTA